MAKITCEKKVINTLNALNNLYFVSKCVCTDSTLQIGDDWGW